MSDKARGSEPAIVPSVEAADAFLELDPPGSDPRGEARKESGRLKDRLDDYNNSCHDEGDDDDDGDDEGDGDDDDDDGGGGGDDDEDES